MKKTRITNFIKNIDINEYRGTIIIPIIPINFTQRSIKTLTVYLNELLLSSKSALKKREDKLIHQLTSISSDIEVKRNFNLIINNEIIQISDMHKITDQNKHLDQYVNDFSDKIKSFRISVKFTHLFFEYKLTLKREDN